MKKVEEQINRYLTKIGAIFNIEEFLSKEHDKQSIIEYYDASDLGYRLFHSAQGSVHMALNFKGVFNKKGYYEQPKYVNDYIQDNNICSVLELASGKGFNSIFLAHENPQVSFFGIDLTPRFVSISRARSKGLNNLCFMVNDFHKIAYGPESFDVVFEIESLCHAANMKVALGEIWRVLKPGGVLILFDGFRKGDFSTFPDSFKTAAKLVEYSMAISSSWEINDWLDLASSQGFERIRVEDISNAIMPNLRRFEFMAKGYFKYRFISSVLLKILSKRLIANSIAGLLMRSTVQIGLQGYYRILLKKT